MKDERIKREIDAVRNLGEQIGYANLMALASALWREKLAPDGVEIGAFVPVCTFQIKKSEMKMVEREIRINDGLIKSNK